MKGHPARSARTLVFCLFAGVIACGSGENAPPLDAEGAGECRSWTIEELKALEKEPGSLPAVQQAIEPAGAIIDGVGGAPGPSPATGPADAPIRIYLFTDFQCPVCRRAAEPVKLLAHTLASDVRVVVKHVDNHRRSSAAAVASLAAFRQGRFWEYHDALFAAPRKLGREDLLEHARVLGLDMERFRADLDDPMLRDQVRYETELARKLEAANTPTLIVNGRLQRGWSSYLGLQRLVATALADVDRLRAEGVAEHRLGLEATNASGDDGPRIARLLGPPSPNP